MGLLHSMKSASAQVGAMELSALASHFKACSPLHQAEVSTSQ
jgi:hypothetical protein